MLDILTSLLNDPLATYTFLNPILANSLTLTSIDGTFLSSPVNPTSAINAILASIPLLL